MRAVALGRAPWRQRERRAGPRTASHQAPVASDGTFQGPALALRVHVHPRCPGRGGDPRAVSNSPFQGRAPRGCDFLFLFSVPETLVLTASFPSGEQSGEGRRGGDSGGGSRSQVSRLMPGSSLGRSLQPLGTGAQICAAICWVDTGHQVARCPAGEAPDKEVLAGSVSESCAGPRTGTKVAGSDPSHLAGRSGL